MDLPGELRKRFRLAGCLSRQRVNSGRATVGVARQLSAEPEDDLACIT